MENLTEILKMGGYGMYVWPSFIVAAIIILSMLTFSLYSLRHVQKTLRNLQTFQRELGSDDKDSES